MEWLRQVKLADLLFKLYKNDFKNMPAYEFTPQKSEFIPQNNQSSPLPRSIPEAQGVSSAHLEAFLKELSQSKDANVHSVVVVRHGKLIMDAHFKPFRGDYPHMLYSMSKSVVSAAVGIAIGEGLFSIDDKIVDIFPEAVSRFHDQRLDQITVKHLLIMSSGIGFNEVGCFTSAEWIKGFMQSDIVFNPGEKFAYNSMNTYILAAIVCKKTGMRLMNYLTPRLFEPLQIKGASWEVCPQGIEKGGWGLYLKVEDMAKIGQLYLQKGKWIVNGEEKQIIPMDWIEESTGEQIATNKEDSSKSYGYQIWSFPAEGAYQFNGMFGQYVIVIPENDIVLAITGGSQNLFPEGSTLEIVKKYFKSKSLFLDLPLSVNKKLLKSYVSTLKGLDFIKGESAFIKEKENIFSYIKSVLFKNDSADIELTRKENLYNEREYNIKKIKISVLPFVLQFVHGNFTDGIEKVKFLLSHKKYEIFITEDNHTNKINAGIDEPLYSTISINNEVYYVGATAKWTTDEDDNDVLKLFISFIETPDTRILKFIFKPEKLIIKFEEIPSVDFASKMLSSVVDKQIKYSSIPGVDNIISGEKIIEKVNNILYPTTDGTLIE